MNSIRVALAQSRSDLLASLLADALMRSSDFDLVGGCVCDLAMVGSVVGNAAHRIDALIVVGEMGSTVLDEHLGGHPGIIVSHIVIGSDAVRFDLRSVGVDQLLSTLTALVRNRASTAPRALAYQAGPSRRFDGEYEFVPLPSRNVVAKLAAGWIDAALLHHQDRFMPAAGDVPGLMRNPASLRQVITSQGKPEENEETSLASAILFEALAEPSSGDEALGRLYRSLGLSMLEMKALLLALAPDLDSKYQVAFGILNDDLCRRGPSTGLACKILGDAQSVRTTLSRAGGLTRWHMFDGSAHLPRGDEVMRLDAALAAWLLGDAGALLCDPAIAGAIRHEPWRGANLLSDPIDQNLSERLAAVMSPNPNEGRWIILGGADSDGWRALGELAAYQGGPPLLRISLEALASMPRDAANAAAVRLARAAALLGASPVIDAVMNDVKDGSDAVLAMLARAMSGLPQGIALITADVKRFVGLLHDQIVAVLERDAPAPPALAAVYKTAGLQAAFPLGDETCLRLAPRFPLALGAIEDAVRLAALQGSAGAAPEAQYAALAAACRHVSSPDMPRFAKRIAPSFTLDDIVLPSEWHRQLHELVDNVVHAPQVLSDWGFASSMPQGRGIAALFHGPSGTGKTTAAQAIAKALDTDVFQADLSLLESKFIGETAKNVDAVFTDAERSHAVLVCDEADAILGKRSEIKDAHDRYANIDVAYLLQRIEAYSGLVILTTNFRQNIDQAFLRRFRFVIEFPRPDALAREQIWRKCLPGPAPVSADVDFGFLARRVELTGGNIRQITVRAAFAAAAGQAPAIAMRHILAATRAELVKADMVTAVRDLDELEALRLRNLRQAA